VVVPIPDIGEGPGAASNRESAAGTVHNVSPARVTKRPQASDDRQLRSFAVLAANLLNDRHCEDVRLIDVRGLSQVCDYVLVASGTSNRQMRSVADELATLGDEHAHRAFRTSSDTAATWIVVDFIDLVVHLFEPTTRAYYDLESLWSDGEMVGWQRDGEHLPRQRRRPAETE
jgi:ribosome-associated protein